MYCPRHRCPDCYVIRSGNLNALVLGCCTHTAERRRQDHNPRHWRRYFEWCIAA